MKRTLQILVTHTMILTGAMAGDLTPQELASIEGVNWWKFTLAASQVEEYKSVVIGVQLSDGTCSNVCVATLAGTAKEAVQVVASLKRVPGAQDVVVFLSVKTLNGAGQVGWKVAPFDGNSTTATRGSGDLQMLPDEKLPLMSNNELKIGKCSTVLYLHLEPKLTGEPSDAPRPADGK